MIKSSVWKQICFLYPICLSSFAVHAGSKGFNTQGDRLASTRLANAPLTSKITLYVPLRSHPLTAIAQTRKQQGIRSLHPLIHTQADRLVSLPDRNWPETQLTDSLLSEYSGTFDFADFPSMNIFLDNGDLYCQTNQGKSILKKLTQPDSFVIENQQANLKFNRNSTGAITSVALEAHGFSSIGKKQKTFRLLLLPD